MFLFMHCNNHCPVNLKEQRLLELIVPTSDYYQSNKKRGKKLSQKMSYFAVGMETGKLIIPEGRSFDRLSYYFNYFSKSF